MLDIPPPPFPPPGGDVAPVDPPPPPIVPPRGARPHGNPGLWASTADYPTRELRDGDQGTTRFSLTIGTDGRVQSCTVTTSSGFPGLDKATCDNVSRRARFEPATDGSGTRVPGTYSGSIRWVIPQD
jgi:protein TonB